MSHASAPSHVARFFILSAALALSAACNATDYRGNQFVAFPGLSTFNRGTAENDGDVYTSPQLKSAFAFDELIASWGANAMEDGGLKIEVRAVYPEHCTKYYVMGIWSTDPEKSPRQSVLHQKDGDGNVSTDTLELMRPANRYQLRVTLTGKAKPVVKYLAVCLTDARQWPAALAPNKAAWGKTLGVPERSQMAYPNGNVICSPTTVSMLLAYWGQELKKPEIDHDVPAVVKGVYDENWHGTGNWPFNTAYAGSLPGMRGCVSRFSDVSELEAWIVKGLPVGLSLDYDRLRGKGPGPNGHLVVCVGFTKDGDPIINDPGTSKNVRKTFPRKNLVYAWAASRNAVYLIYPAQGKLPINHFRHW